VTVLTLEEKPTEFLTPVGFIAGENNGKKGSEATLVEFICHILVFHFKKLLQLYI
jgi:hypothetical protein